MANSAQEQRAVEEAVYTHDYAGYRPDPLFAQTMRLILDREIVTRSPPPGEALDVGCGAGDFLIAAAERGYSALGIDVSYSSAQICQSRGADAVAGDYLAEDFGRKFDLITMWDVIEHLRDPAMFFDRTRQLLNHDGIFFGKVPAFGGLSVGFASKMPRLAGLLLGAPDHIQYFNRASLAHLAKRRGFTIEWLEPPIGRLRQPATGGTLKRRIGRLLAKLIKKMSGDGNLYFVAKIRSFA